MRKIYFVALLALASACYRPPTVDGFDPVLWRTAIDECGTYRVEAVRVLLDQKDQLLGLNQNEIAELLGPAARHELFSRNQKFFFYQLSCENEQELSIRFDALGRIKELQVIRVQ